MILPFRRNATRKGLLDWHVTRGLSRVDQNSADKFAGIVELGDGKSAYVILGSSSASFKALPVGAGIQVSEQELHIIDARYKLSGDMRAGLLLLEFDQQGARVGTVRGSREELLHYRAGKGVDKILVCLRLEGPGTAEIETLSWTRDTRIFHEAIFPSARPTIRPDGPKVIWLPSDGAKPFTIWPHDHVKIVSMGLSAGRYTLDFLHRDAAVADQVRPFEARFALATPPAPGSNLSVLGFDDQIDGRPVGFPRVRSRAKGRFRTSCSFLLTEPQDWVVIDLAMGLDRFFNVDNVVIQPDRPDATVVEERLFASEVAAYVDLLEAKEGISGILYADISPNIVDGSSVWLSSVASIMAGLGQCLLVSSRNIENDLILSNIRNRGRLTILTPADIGYPKDRFSIEDACHVIRRLDERLPAVRNVVVRGCEVAERLLRTRQFRGRAFPYLTDFYEIGADGIVFPAHRRKQVRIASIHAARLLVQTPQVGEALEESAGRPAETFYLPPSIPPIEPSLLAQPRQTGERVSIGYAGKINPQWGIIEMLDWVERLRDEGVDVDLHLATGKVSNRSGAYAVDGMRENIVSRIEALGGQFHENLKRDESMELMSQMDFVWCWRPASLEEHTLELSTKLVEMVACQARCICFPNAINLGALGDGYAFYAEGFDQFQQIVRERRAPDMALASRIRHDHSQETIRHRLAHDCFNSTPARPRPRMVISGHGLKFIDPYASYLKAQGHQVIRDMWEWSAPLDEAATQAAAEWADIVFCEWGLANAAWHSRNLRPGPKLYVRCHAQEVRERAAKWVRQIDASRVDKFIFVSDRVRRKAIELYRWPEEKTVLVPNFVLADEYRFAPRPHGGPIRLGLLGMVPQSKRFDRALDLLVKLRREGFDAELHVKGQRPENLAYMFAPGRGEEMAHYMTQYQRMETDPLLNGAVHFDGWGNDVADWYLGIDHILSPSDHESFHYAVADGVLTGCYPVVWSWEDADRVYPAEWCVADTEAAADRIREFAALGSEQQEEVQRLNRAEMVERYGHETIYPRLDFELGIGDEATG